MQLRRLTALEAEKIRFRTRGKLLVAQIADLQDILARRIAFSKIINTEVAQLKPATPRRDGQ